MLSFGGLWRALSLSDKRLQCTVILPTRFRAQCVLVEGVSYLSIALTPVLARPQRTVARARPRLPLRRERQRLR